MSRRLRDNCTRYDRWLLNYLIWGEYCQFRLQILIKPYLLVHAWQLHCHVLFEGSPLILALFELGLSFEQGLSIAFE